MSDPFSTSHVDWLPGSAGRTSGFAEGMQAGYDQQYHVDSAYGMEDEVYDRWQGSLARLEQATGQKFDMPLDYSSINNYVRAAQGEDPSSWQQAITFHGLDPTEAIKAREPFTKANDTIKQLNDPNIRSMEDIIAEVKRNREGFEQQSALVSETGGIGATIGQFVGAVGGSFSERDPLLVGTLGFGGFGKTAAAKIATEMAAIGSVEAAQQYGTVEPTRALLGEEPGSPLTNVLLAMAGAGLLRGGIEGIARMLRGAERELPEIKPIDEEQLRATFEAEPGSPTARAGIHLLDAQKSFDEVNPYAGSEVGTRRFIAELEDVQRVMSGTTDTAIARFLPEMPIEVQKLDVDSEIVKAERPLVYEQLLATQNRLADIDEQINKTQADIGNLTISDAIARVDEASGDVARSLEEDLANPQLTSTQRAAIVKQLDIIIESLGGAEMVAKKSIDAAIKPKKVLQSLRQSRKAATKAFKAARKQFDQALRDIQAEAKIKEMINQRTTIGDLGSQTHFVDEPPGETLRHDNVETAVRHTEEAAEKVDEQGEAIVRGPEVEEGAPVPKDDGMLDLGNGIKVPKNFEFVLGDEFGNSTTMSAEAIMKDLKDDLDLQEAVKVCSI